MGGSSRSGVFSLASVGVYMPRCTTHGSCAGHIVVGENHPVAFGTFVVERVLGPGAYGITYLVRDEDSQPLALKWLKADAPAEGRFRFENEVWALSKLNHRSVPKFVRKGEHEGRPYIVMSYFPGTTLRYVLETNRKEGGALSQLKGLIVAEGLFDVLHHLHQNGIVHRDVKDDNVIVSTSGGEIGLIDLGVCKGESAPAEGKTFWNAGASRFSPPSKLEHAASEDPKHDVFAVGVLCYLMLTNQFPWEVPPGEDAGHLREFMLSHTPRPVREINPFVDKTFSDLISHLIDVKDWSRPTAPEALEKIKAVKERLETKNPSVISEFGLLKFPRVMRDALHGDIPLTNFEHQIISTKEFQKLRRIRQLGFSHLVFPGAEHSRFNHALGTMYLADKILSRIELRTGSAFDSDERLMVRTFALVHDVAHVAYGHTLEDELAFFERHDKNESRIERMLVSSKSEFVAAMERTEYGRAVLDILADQQSMSSDNWIAELVSSATGADVLDYIDRDSLFCGLDHRVDSAIFRQFSVDKSSRAPGARRHLVNKLYGRHGFRIDAEYAMLSLLRERFGLFLKVYTHPTKIVAGAMLGKAFYESQLSESDIETMGDEELLLQLRGSPKQFVSRTGAALIDRKLYRAVFRARALGNEQRSTDQYRSRQEILEALGVFTPSGRAKFERELAKAASVSSDDVIVYATRNAPGTQKVEQFVEVGKGHRRVRDSAHRSHQEIFKDHLSLWTVYVLVNPELSEERKIFVAEEAEGRFPLKNEINLDRRQLALDV